MTDSNLIANPTLPRTRWIALPAVAVFGLVGAVLWRRRAQLELVLAPAEPVVIPMPVMAVSTPELPTKPARVQSPWRWLLFLIVTVVSAGLLVVLQGQSPEVSMAVFWLVVIGAVGYGLVRSVKITPRPQAKPARVQSPWRWLLFLFITVLCAGLLVALQNQSPEISTGMFWLAVIAAVGYGTVRSAKSVVRQREAIRSFADYLWRLLQAHKDAASFLGIGFAAVCVVSSALLLKDARNYSPLLNQALFWLIAAWLTLGFVIVIRSHIVLPESWLARGDVTIRRAAPFNLTRASAGLLATMSGIFLLFLLAEVNGNVLKSSLLQNVHHVTQLAFLMLGIVLLVLGIGGRPRLPSMTKDEALWLAGIVLLAFILRAVALDSVVRRYVDEVNFMDAIPRLWAAPNTRILTPFSDTTAFTWFYPLLQSATSNIVGSGLPGLRLISSVFGTLGVPALYFLVRTLFHDKRLALMSALVLATLPVHLHFSRIGLNNIADPFFGTLALAFLMRGLQSHMRSDYVVAGALMGLTQYFYEGGRLLFPPLLVLVFVILWLKNGRQKADLIHAAYALLVAVLIAAPVYYTLIGGGSFLTPRLNEQSMGGSLWTRLLDTDLPLGEVLRGRFIDPFLTAISIPDQGWFYGGQQPFILFAFVPLFLIGVGYALWNIRTPGMLIFVLWAVATCLGNSLLRENLWSPRYVVDFPALAFLLALGIYVALALIWPRSRPARGRYLILAACSLIVATAQTAYYFLDHAPGYMQQFQMEEDWNDAFFRTVDLPRGTSVHLIMKIPVWKINMVAFTDYNRLDLQMDAISPAELSPAYVKRILQDKKNNHVFFVNPYDAQLLSHLRQYFILSSPQLSPYGIPVRDQLGLYHILDDLQ
jgi:4-amino-4-deoxy-L-arabinose transferase-like glycosyltransferase